MYAPPRAGPHEIIHALSLEAISSTSTDCSTLCELPFYRFVSFSFLFIFFKYNKSSLFLRSYLLSLLSVDAV